MSRELTFATEKTKLETKFEKKMGHEAYAKMVTEHEAMSKEQLEARMLELAKTHQGIINTRNSDVELEDAKQEVQRHAQPYKDQIKANQDLVRYVSLVMSEKFGDKLMDLQKAEENEADE
jgi:hypothetical protein